MKDVILINIANTSGIIPEGRMESVEEEIVIKYLITIVWRRKHSNEFPIMLNLIAFILYFVRSHN